MNDRIHRALPDRRMLMQLFGFGAGISLAAYFTGGASVSNAAAIFVVVSIYFLGCWFAGSSYPTIGGYRRSLPDTLKYASGSGLLFGLTVYLTLFFLGKADSFDLLDAAVRMLTLAGIWFCCTMFF